MSRYIFLWFCYAFNTMGRYDLDMGDVQVRFHLRKDLRKLYDGYNAILIRLGCGSSISD